MRNIEKVWQHVHTDISNVNGYADSCTSYMDYIKLAVRDGDKAIAFSEHGGVYEWIKKKQACDKAGLKYIHGVEHYMCNELSDNDRGYHIGLYSRNWEGVQELNKLVSISTEKDTNRHMYFNPRLSMEEIMNTSDNIIITTACLQSVLWRFTEKYNRMTCIDFDTSSLNAAETHKFNKMKLLNMTDDQIEKYNKLKGKKKSIFISEIEHDITKLADFYIQQRDLFLGWMSDNSHRCFLEVQAHNMYDQIEYNKLILEWSTKYDIPVIAGTDTHSSTKYKSECRKILQIAKDSFYGDEDALDLVWQTGNELFEEFKSQGVLSEEEILNAINNTLVFSDMVDNFELNYDFKYPTLYGDKADDLLRDMTYKMLYEKQGISELVDGVDINKYIENIEIELSAFKKQGMSGFIYFMAELLQWCVENDIPYGDRGSVGGSQVCFITNVTDIDPIRWGTVFSRFCNESRISLGDVDVDFASEDRPKVYEYITSRFTSDKVAYILTMGTLQDRGTIDTLAKGLSGDGEDVDYELVKSIKNTFDKLDSGYKKIVSEEVNVEELEGDEVDAKSVGFDHHNVYMNRIRNKEKSKELDIIKGKWDTLKGDNQDIFYYFEGLKGTIISKGRHAAGFIGSPITLPDNMGVHYEKGDSSRPVSTNSMKGVDSLNYVKFDILGLNTIGVIKDVYKYLGKKWERSYQIDWEDQAVWDNMIGSPIGVFQFESAYSHKLLSDFKPTTINHMSMVNAGLRPSGKSYRDRLIAGEFNKNPSEEIDKLLEANKGYLIFQEDTIKFLTDICDFSGGLADTTRRAIGKKDKVQLAEQLPLIIEGYCNHSTKPREIAENEVKEFVQIVSDSSEYQFGLNHSTGYSKNGYMCVRHRTHNPIEFCTAYLNRASNAEDVLNGTELAKSYGFKISPVKFRKAMSEYNFDKQSGTIYKGTASIKDIGVKNGDELYTLKNNVYETFTQLLSDIKNNTSVNQGQILTLIKLDYFSEFGKSKKLSEVLKLFHDWNSKKTAKFFNKSKGIDVALDFPDELLEKYSDKKTECQYSNVRFLELISEYETLIPNEDITFKEKIDTQLDHLGYINYTDPTMDKRYTLVTKLDTKYSPRIQGYCLNNGATVTLKAKNKPKSKKYAKKEITYYQDVPFENGDLLYVNTFSHENDVKKLNEDQIAELPDDQKNKVNKNGWITLDSKSWWITNYYKVQ